MYQIEVKRLLVQHAFDPCEGWEVTIHLDSMELAIGGSHRHDKHGIAADCKKWLSDKNVSLTAHDIYGPADLVATHADHGTFVIEVEGDSTRQSEQAMYSALGQVILSMGKLPIGVFFGIAFPDSPTWERQVQKIPREVYQRLNLKAYLVSNSLLRTY